MFFLLRLVRWALSLVVVLAAAAGLTLWLFVWPSTDAPRRADAVVVLAGGDGERLDDALDLMRLGVAPTLVLYRARKSSAARAARACEGNEAFAVLCPPAPPDARAEARALADLAEKKGWRRLVVVTSRYDVSKARLLVGSCFGGRLDVVGAKPPVEAWVRAVPGQWKSYVSALLVERGC